MSGRAIARLVLFAVFAAAGIARADEIRLKDGTKINGTIVGYENDSFKIETAYGFALVRKDKVAEIIPSTAKKEPEPKATTPAPVVSPPPVSKEPSPAAAAVPNANTSASTSATTRPPAKPNTSPVPPKADSSTVTSSAKTPVAPVAPVAPIAPTPPSAAPATPKVPPVPPALAAPPAPPVIRDEVSGNLYLNHTYGFEMYKPPSWDLIPGARTALPDAVAALGTSDETTLLVIGLEHTNDSLDAHAAATEKALSEAYDNYRSISGRRTKIAESPAIERRARGTADGRDWSVILMTFSHGNEMFTLLGMTWADSDLIQVEENVITKVVNSLMFAPVTSH